MGKVDPALEMPRYESVEREGRFEIRQYAPYVVAETTVEGEYDEAARQAFRRLAAYIFGANSGQNKIAMTAPVASESTEDDGQRIAMTAPVESVQSENVEPGLDRKAKWKTSFMMPSQFSMETLPKPNDDRVVFAERPARTVGVIVFNGFVTDAVVAQRLDELKTWLQARGQQWTGPYTLARYNDPFTLPWNRRNELQIRVESL
jgi:hypothetical protein